MASSKEYLYFVLEQLSGLGEITYRAMMSEYIIYYRGKIIDDKNFLTQLFNAVYDDLPMPKKKKV